MVLAATFGDRVLFDSLNAYRKAHSSALSPKLMAWKQSACKDVEGDDAATDGDLWNAYGLKLAARQWGGSYGTEAADLIGAIRSSELNGNSKLPTLGDWAKGGSYGNDTRTSDLTTEFFRAFGWEDTRTNSYTLLSKAVTKWSGGPGLVPDFVLNTDGTIALPGSSYLAGETTPQHYRWNACRTPAVVGLDFVLNGRSSAKSFISKINGWVQTKTGSTPSGIRAGYTLGGNALVSYGGLCFDAGFAVASMSGPQSWTTKMWSRLANRTPSGEDYYGETWRLLGMLIMSGNWLKP
jgi:endo-1,4-beta-D-glucanase Y